MASSPRIAVLGSFNMDLVMRCERYPAAGETLQGSFGMYLGGKGFNQAVAARRLGAEVAVIGRVGDDDFGRAFLEALDAEGIARGGVTVRDRASTGVASVLVDGRGANAIVQAPQANRELSAVDVERAFSGVPAPRVAMLQLETSDAAAIAFASAARDAGAVVVLNPAPLGPVPAELLRLCDVVVPNESEVAAITGIEPASVEQAFAAADALRALGPRNAIITLGARGCVGVGDGQRIHIEPLPVDVVDTVGAGDAFCGALAVALAESAPLAEAMSFANAAGALACTRPGAEPSMPGRAEVERLIGERAPRG